MTVRASKPAINIREKLASRGMQAAYVQQQFWFVGDGSETDFAIEKGWRPLHVFDAGSLQKEGASDDYEVTFDGFVYTVSFGTAPTTSNDIGVICVLD
jgi:hypothetical protein